MKDKQEPTKVLLKPTGPLVVYGKVELTLENGETVFRDKATSFCRCGASANMPFCDGRHKEIENPLSR